MYSTFTHPSDWGVRDKAFVASLLYLSCCSRCDFAVDDDEFGFKAFNVFYRGFYKFFCVNTRDADVHHIDAIG